MARTVPASDTCIVIGYRHDVKLLAFGVLAGGLCADPHRTRDLHACPFPHLAALTEGPAFEPRCTDFQTPCPLWLTLAQSVAHTAMVAFVVPPILAFTYANTILFFNIVGGQLLCGLHGSRDRFYALYALLGSVPIMVATWAEPLFCDALLIRYGGHLFFDASIPASVLLYYSIAAGLPPRKATKEA